MKKNIVIVVLFIISISLAVYIGYYTNSANKNYQTKIKSLEKRNSKQTKEIEKLNKEIKEIMKKNKCTNSKYNLYELYGDYEYKLPVTLYNGAKVVHKVEISLKPNGIASVHQSDGMAAEFTKGTYTCENNKILYDGNESDYDNNNSKLDNIVKKEITIADKNTLEYTFNNKKILVKRK